MARLLIVEDQLTLQNAMRRGLEAEGYEVICGSSGAEGYRLALSEHPDAIVLDLLLPDGDGLSILTRLRGEGFHKPVIIVTARDAVEHRIIGLEFGADDYLVKPFAFGELAARLKALLRRDARTAETTFSAGDLVLHLVTRLVTRGDQQVELTPKQFDLLAYLIQHKNELVTREMLARDVWKASTATWTNVIEVQMTNLRKKIEGPGKPPLLHTIRGEGYLLGERPW